jgi:glycosyltransferase EpsE
MDAVGGYTEDPRMLRVEDVNLWIKLYAAGFRGYNIQQPLYRMRNDQNALNRRKYIYRINSAYVRLLGCRMLKLGPKSYAKACMPMIVGLVPAKLRQMIRKRQGRTA